MTSAPTLRYQTTLQSVATCQAVRRPSISLCKCYYHWIGKSKFALNTAVLIIFVYDETFDLISRRGRLVKKHRCRLWGAARARAPPIIRMGGQNPFFAPQ